MTEEQREREKRLVLGMIEVDGTTGCWNWLGKRIKRYGYAQRGNWRKGEKRYLSVHRLAFRLWNGEIPDGFEVDHLCENKGCCCPSHLEIVTHGENVRRAVARKRARLHKAS